MAFVAITVTTAWTTAASEPPWGPDSSWSTQDHSIDSLRREVQRLGSDSYATRQIAAQRLFDAGRLATHPLQSALEHSSLDMRTQARLLLRKIHDRQIDYELERLLALNNDGGKSRLPLWEPFRDYVGDDWNSRRVYGELVNRYRESATALSGDTLCGYRPPSPGRLDPLRLNRTDKIGWMMVLLVDLAIDQAPRVIRSTAAPMMASVRMPADRLSTASLIATSTMNERPALVDHVPRYLSLSSRLAMALTQGTAGPVLNTRTTTSATSGDEELRRLIGAWVADERTQVNDRDRLMIAMRYRCLEQARESCESILNRPTSDPHAIAMALLSAAALNCPNLEQQLERFGSDRRIAQHRQRIGTRGILVQTQVRDVVLALRLRLQGIDPRAVGFSELQADPLCVYRECSLGFSNNEARESCFQSAAFLLSDL